MNLSHFRVLSLAALLGAAPAPPAGASAPHASAPAAHAAPAAPAAPHAAVAPPASHSSAARPATRRSAITALAELIRGNDRFVAGRSAHPRQGAVRRSELASGQHPSAIVLACADSRVPPEVVFDQGLGDVFVVRAAGEVLDHSVVSSIEYAVEHLHAPLVVVMGHHACGAVRTAMTVAPESAGSEDLAYLVGAIRPAVASFGAPAPGDRTLAEPVRAQVDATVAALLRRSAIVREHVSRGQLTVVPAMYALESGAVEMWDSGPSLASDD